jgi:hypothetical protein
LQAIEPPQNYALGMNLEKKNTKLQECIETSYASAKFVIPYLHKFISQQIQLISFSILLGIPSHIYFGEQWTTGTNIYHINKP